MRREPPTLLHFANSSVIKTLMPAFHVCVACLHVLNLIFTSFRRCPGVNVLGLFKLHPLSGSGAFWLWRSCYFSEVFTNRSRAQLVFDWTRSKVFGRDITRE